MDMVELSLDFRLYADSETESSSRSSSEVWSPTEDRGALDGERARVMSALGSETICDGWMGGVGWVVAGDWSVVLLRVGMCPVSSSMGSASGGLDNTVSHGHDRQEQLVWFETRSTKNQDKERQTWDERQGVRTIGCGEGLAVARSPLPLQCHCQTRLDLMLGSRRG